MSFRPMKPREIGSEHDMLARLYADCGGAARVGLYAGLSKTQVYRLADPAEADNGGRISFALVLRLALLSGSTAPAELLAGAVGASVLPALPAGADADWSAFMRETGTEYAEFVSALFDALGQESATPGTVGAEEAAQLMAELDDVLRALMRGKALLAALVRGGTGEGGEGAGTGESA